MKRLCLALLSTVLMQAAWADKLPMPADAPPSYGEDCGGCHMAYPPALLMADDWQKLMLNLKDHFGTDASLSTSAYQEINRFLVANGGNARRPGVSDRSLRITKTPRFLRKHDEIPARMWRDPRVKSAANCEACHRGAGTGRFSEHDLVLPELRGR